MLGLFTKIPFLYTAFGISAGDRKLLSGKLIGISEGGTLNLKQSPGSYKHTESLL